MATKVINIKSGEKYDVYIGRRIKNERYHFEGSVWENPYVKGKDYKTLERANYLYAKWLLQNEWMLKHVSKLRGKVLGCWCKQDGKNVACHGDILATIAEMSLEDAKKYLEEFKPNIQAEMKI